MYIAFYSTSDVFVGEERLKEKSIECKIVPTPVTDKAYCGVCIECEEAALKVLSDLDFKVVEGGA